MTLSTVRGNVAPALAAIAAREVFSTSSALTVARYFLHGHGYSRPAAVRSQHAAANAVDYVIYSYSTPIAWHTPDGWTYVADKFSQSTGRHQTTVRRALAGLDYRTVSGA